MSLPVKTRAQWVEYSPDYSIQRQCNLAGICRSRFYYQRAVESDEDSLYKRLIDEHYMRHPEYGSPRMTNWLHDEGYKVNHKRVARLMRDMGLQAITPGPHTSKRCPGHKIYPYLLRGVDISHVNQVWSTDITYIPMKKGYLYLTAVMDWYSRYVLSWELSNTMDSSFCVDALKRALKVYGDPEIFNTDQGSQFTCGEFTSVLQANDILISMDGRGRALDNVFIERLWWSLKYEDIYPNVYGCGKTLHEGLSRYFKRYNEKRKHSALDNKTPAEIFFKEVS